MAYFVPTDWELKDFYRANADSLFRCCNFLTCGQGDSEAMVKDIFLMLLNKGMIFSSDKDGKAWMILTAYKLSRKTKKYARTSSEPLPEQNLEPVMTLPEDASLPETDEAEPSVAETTDAEKVDAVDSTDASPDVTEEEETAPGEEETGEISVEEQSARSLFVFPEELRKLSRKDRLIALMYYCEGFRKSEIATYLGCTTFVITARLKRIKKRILQEKGGDE